MNEIVIWFTKQCFHYVCGTKKLVLCRFYYNDSLAASTARLARTPILSCKIVSKFFGQHYPEKLNTNSVAVWRSWRSVVSSGRNRNRKLDKKEAISLSRLPVGIISEKRG